MAVEVSVVMPCRNVEPWVGEAVRSVLGQRFTDFELIVVDDGSEDETVRVVQSFLDRRIRIVRAGRVGFVQALNAGFREARGEWVARMDGDDIMHPDRLRAQVAFLRENPCLFVSCQRSILTPGGKCLVPVRRFEARWLTVADITLRRIQFTEGATVFDRRGASDVQFYDEEFDNETSLYYKLLARGRGAVLGDVLYAYRLRPDSHSKTDILGRFRGNLAVRQKYDPSNAARLLELAAAKTARGAPEVELFSRLVKVCVVAGDLECARSIAATVAMRWPLEARSWRMVLSALTGWTSARVWRRDPGVAGWQDAAGPWQDGNQDADSAAATRHGR